MESLLQLSQWSNVAQTKLENPKFEEKKLKLYKPKTIKTNNCNKKPKLQWKKKMQKKIKWNDPM